jgi:hypothetical protein
MLLHTHARTKADDSSIIVVRSPGTVRGPDGIDTEPVNTGLDSQNLLPVFQSF